MRKLKTALLVSAALLATSAQAWEYNWLLGVSAGGAWHGNNDDVTLTIADPNAVPPLFESITLNGNNNDDDNFIWGFLAGFQGRCNGWLLGGEVNVDWRGNGNDDNFTVDSVLVGPAGVVGTIHRDRDPVWGLTGRIGYEVAPFFMPYIRLGADWGRRNFSFTAATTNLLQNITVAAGNDDDNSKWGFVGGIGAEFPLPVMAGLSLRAEWDYHSRKHDDNNIVGLASDGTSIFTLNGGTSHENTARASLVFNFPA